MAICADDSRNNAGSGNNLGHINNPGSRNNLGHINNPGSGNIPGFENNPGFGNNLGYENNPGNENMHIDEPEDNKIQKLQQVNKQLVVRIQRLKNCHDVLGIVMSYAENYARMKGYKGKMEFNKYDYFYSSQNTKESLYRTKFAAQIFNFENAFKFYVEQYGKFEFAKSLPAKDIITRIDNYMKFIPKEDRNLYINLKKIINNQKTTIYEDELSKHVSKAKMDINKMDIFLIAGAKVDYENEIEAQKVIKNNSYIPDMGLNKENPDWTHYNFNDKKRRIDENNEDQK